jgi:methyltransferase (TIGR00027 family)
MTSPTRAASFTALMSAAARAAHLLVDPAPHVFADSLAASWLGESAEQMLGPHRGFPHHPVLAGARATAVIRARYAEDRLAAAYAQGVRQYVVLGAGVDSFAYRTEWGHDLRVFEVDQPAMSTYKQDLVAGLAPLTGLAFVPARLGEDPLLPALVDAGLDPTEPVFATGLGVTNYLPVSLIQAVLVDLAGVAPGSSLVLDYIVPAPLRDQAGTSYAEAVMQAAAERGEPWITFLTSGEAADLLQASGWRVEEDLAQDAAIDAEMRNQADGLPRFELTRLVTARLR